MLQLAPKKHAAGHSAEEDGSGRGEEGGEHGLVEGLVGGEHGVRRPYDSHEDAEEPARLVGIDSAAKGQVRRVVEVACKAKREAHPVDCERYRHWRRDADGLLHIGRQHLKEAQAEATGEDGHDHEQHMHDWHACEPMPMDAIPLLLFEVVDLVDEGNGATLHAASPVAEVIGEEICVSAPASTAFAVAVIHTSPVRAVETCPHPASSAQASRRWGSYGHYEDAKGKK
eukprot:181164-Pleurochrysis_carterae.AAC.4